MTRHALNVLSIKHHSLFDEWEWYRFQRALIGEEESRVLDAIDRGITLAGDRYIGRTRQEVERLFALQKSELTQLAMLGMFTCTEAALRVDFIERVKNRKKDLVSREFRNRYIRTKRDLRKVRLEEDILDIRRKHASNTQLKAAVAELKGAWKLRDWLAHGRYWEPKLGRASGYDPVDVFEICSRLLQEAHLMRPLTE